MTNLEKYNQVFMEHFTEVMQNGILWHIWNYVLFLKKHLTLPWKRLIFLLFPLMRRAWRS